MLEMTKKEEEKVYRKGFNSGFRMAIAGLVIRAKIEEKEFITLEFLENLDFEKLLKKDN